VERLRFDRNITYFLVWKLTNFDEWKCVSLLWEMNSYNHCFSHPKLHPRVVFQTFSVFNYANGFGKFFALFILAITFRVLKLATKTSRTVSKLFQATSCQKWRRSGWKHNKKNIKWFGAMFWQNWVDEKMVKFRQLSKIDHVCYLYASVH
jgi:hypothetical protein